MLIIGVDYHCVLPPVWKLINGSIQSLLVLLAQSR